MNKEALKRMALQVGELLCQSPETGKPLGIWEICKSTGAIGLGTPEGDEFWILETLLHESNELEVKRLNLNNGFETMLERLQYAEKSERNAQLLLGGALKLLSEAGINPGSRELLEAAERAEINESSSDYTKERQERMKNDTRTVTEIAGEIELKRHIKRLGREAHEELNKNNP